MIPESPQYSKTQWKFLATLEAFGSLVPIDVVGALAPLTPGPLFDLLRRAREYGIIQQTDADDFGLAPNLPPALLEKLQSFNSQDRASEIFDQLNSTGLITRLNPSTIFHLLIKAKRFDEAASIQLNMAEEAIKAQDLETAFANLTQIIEFHVQNSEILGIENRLIQQTLAVSNLCIALGKGFAEVLPLLQKLLIVSKVSGDRRSQAIILLHLGRLYYLSYMNAESLKAFTDGTQIVEELGDEDILFQSAEFVGLFHFMQGNFRQALIHYERASEWDRYTESDIINPFAPIFFSLTAMALGQFNRAFDLMDIFHRFATQKKLSNAATTMRAILGYMLLAFNKEKEALYHLSLASQEAKKQNKCPCNLRSRTLQSVSPIP